MIKRARLDMGWSQTRLAEEAGLSRQLLSLVENGHGNCTLATVDALARGVGMHYVLVLTTDDQALYAGIRQLVADLEKPKL